MKTTVLFVCLVFVCFIASSGFAKTYYVSTSGSDTADGSEMSPYKTIARAATIVNPGDTVLVFGGSYTEQNILPGNSGNGNAMTVFKPNPGTGAVIIKHPGNSLNDNTAVFNLTGRSYIRIEGFQFKDFQYGRSSIFIDNGMGNIVINNRFENLGNSQAESWNANSVIWVYRSSGNTIRNNYFNNITGDAVSLNGQTAVNNLVSDNTFLNFKGKRRDWGGTNLFSRAIDVQDMSNGNNVVAFNYASGVINHIWLDRDGSNNVMLRNVAHNSSGLIFNESRCALNVIQENIGYNLNIAYHTASYPETGWTFDARWVNNVAFNNKTGFYVHKSHRDEFRNNIAFNNTDFNLDFTREAMGNGPHVFKNNLWFTENKPNSIRLGGNPVSVSQFQSAIREKNGLSADPLFQNTNPGTEDFRLQQASPARNAGDSGIDMGAYAVYGPTTVGWDASLQLAGVQVYFESVISSAKSGEQTHINLKLSNAAAERITLAIIPVAGDARVGEDFELANQSVTFEPGETSKTVSVTVVSIADHDKLVAFRFADVLNAQAGSRNLHLLRIKGTPKLTAYAGLNQTVYETDDSGTGTVSLDAFRSSDPDGTITSYVWTLGGSQLETGVNPAVNLPLGTHHITLTVTDNDGNTATDEVTIAVVGGSGIWLEAECGVVGSMWNTEQDSKATNGNYVTIRPGNNSTDNAPSDPDGHITYTFNVSESGAHGLWLRVLCPTANDDSFWLKMDNGSFLSWNDITNSSSWVWVKYRSTFSLSPGSHTFTIAYREDGAKLDKIWFTKTEDTPYGEGKPTAGCVVTSLSAKQDNAITIYPNPVNHMLHVNLPGSLSGISLYKSNGQELLIHKPEASQDFMLDMSPYLPGVYFIKFISPDRTVVKRILKK